jgi:tetratricopeptide (TPR) repeat protein
MMLQEKHKNTLFQSQIKTLTIGIIVGLLLAVGTFAIVTQVVPRLTMRDAQVIWDEIAETDYENQAVLVGIEELTRNIEFDRNNADNYAYRARLYAVSDQDYEAIADANIAIELDGNNVVAYYARGNAYLHQRDYTNAIEDYTRAIEIDSNFAWAYNNRGITYAKLEDYDSAREDYIQAIELDPDNPSPYWELGNTYYDSNDEELALENYCTYADLAETTPDFMQNRIDALGGCP